MSDMMEKSPFATLPIEMTMSVLELLPRKDIINFALICKAMSSIAEDFLYRHITISILDNHYGSKVSLVHQSFVRSQVRVLQSSSTEMAVPPEKRAQFPAISADAMSKIYTVFKLAFPRLNSLIIDTVTPSEPDWRVLFSFLARHPTITVLKLYLWGSSEYYEYDHTGNDERELWRGITPDFLPSLKELSTDCTFLSALVSKKVVSLSQVEFIHIRDQCLGNQYQMWKTIRGAASSFNKLSTLVVSQLPQRTPSGTQPGRLSIVDVLENFPCAFPQTQHLSMNAGEDGYWDAGLLIDYIKVFSNLKTLSIPIRIAHDILTRTNLHGGEQTLAGDQAVTLPYTREADLAYRQTPETQQIVDDIHKTLGDSPPMFKTIIHMPGWRPELMFF